MIILHSVDILVTSRSDLYVKRLIGRKSGDPAVQSDMKHWPFKVISANGGKPKVQVEYKGETKIFTAEEISSMVLGKMKETAERFLGHSVKTNATK
ncbi:Hsp70 family protein [Brugia pahangi]